MNRGEFIRKFGSQYNWLLKNNPEVLDNLLPYVKIKHTHEWVTEEAKKYNSIKEFQKGNSSAYSYARINKILYEICGHMEVKRIYQTHQSATEEAKKYNSRTEFKIGSMSAYGYARKHKILDEICGHMNLSMSKKKKIKCVETGKIFESISECSRMMGLFVANISQYLTRNKKQSHVGGYTFEYVEEKE